MVYREWIEMPVARNRTNSESPRPKYPVETNAVLVYRGEKVYISFENESAVMEAIKQHDVRRLKPDEAREFEESLPFPIPFHTTKNQQNDVSGRLRLGDAVSWMAHKLGIEECGGCRERRSFLNKIIIWGWWKR